MSEIILKATGTTPLLTHNPISMFADNSAKKRQTAIPTPEDEAETGTYRDQDGDFCIPGVAFRGSIIKAAGAYKVKRHAASTILAHIMVKEEMVKLQNGKGGPIKSYTIDRRRAVVQRQGIIRSRPRFDEWSATFTVIYDEDMVPDPEQIISIAQDAGSRVGVGDFRPERKGWFGRFTIERVE